MWFNSLLTSFTVVSFLNPFILLNLFTSFYFKLFATKFSLGQRIHCSSLLCLTHNLFITCHSLWSCSLVTYLCINLKDLVKSCLVNEHCLESVWISLSNLASACFSQMTWLLDVIITITYASRSRIINTNLIGFQNRNVTISKLFKHEMSIKSVIWNY